MAQSEKSKATKLLLGKERSFSGSTWSISSGRRGRLAHQAHLARPLSRSEALIAELASLRSR